MAGASPVASHGVAFDAYGAGRASFVPGLPPSAAMRLTVAETLRLLRARLGDTVDQALRLAASGEPVAVGSLPVSLRSPVVGEPDGRWLTRENVVGINIRTVGDAWGVVRYVLTVPAVQRGIHLLPFLEPGVVGSLYGPASWHVDPAIASRDLAREVPGLDAPETQLRAVVLLLHALGRTVGMDVVPHTDRFSEMVLAQPDHFEWLERAGTRIVRFGDTVTADVERSIHRWLDRWLQADRPVDAIVPETADELFRGLTEAERSRLLFGMPDDAEGRRARRIALVRELHETGFETVPATMAPPYRGLEVDASGAEIVDDLGLSWRDYRISVPGPMSRVFGPLARYALYEPDGRGGWGLDFERPIERVWRYVCGHYADLAERLGFDFMRGDMAHVQMRPEGVPADPGSHYDILGAVRKEVRDRRITWFAYLAESFLAPPGTMGYGDEADHLEAAGADATLGDLQSTAVDDLVFVSQFRRYRDLLETRSFAPCLTVMTADKDDPRFDAFYRTGNEVRLFLALFLPDMPSYMALGFEQRDRHDRPAPNEHYTKLFVFHRETGPSARKGPYVWGRNLSLFGRLERIRRLADELWPRIGDARVTFLRPPDATGVEKVMAWSLEANEPLLCVANLGTYAAPSFGVPAAASAHPGLAWEPLFSTDEEADLQTSLQWSGRNWLVRGLGAGEGRVYKPA